MKMFEWNFSSSAEYVVGIALLVLIVVVLV
jgi:hypothetical protein